jgi:hypothetical protein
MRYDFWLITWEKHKSPQNAPRSGRNRPRTRNEIGDSNRASKASFQTSRMPLTLCCASTRKRVNGSRWRKSLVSCWRINHLLPTQARTEALWRDIEKARLSSLGYGGAAFTHPLGSLPTSRLPFACPSCRPGRSRNAAATMPTHPAGFEFMNSANRAMLVTHA